MNTLEKRFILARRIKEDRKAIQVGVSDNCTVAKTTMRVLILLAQREVIAGGYNKAVEELVLDLYDLARKGYFGEWE